MSIIQPTHSSKLRRLPFALAVCAGAASLLAVLPVGAQAPATPAAAGSGTQASPAASETPASSASGAQVAARLLFFRQLGAVSLTPAQVQDISQRLNRLAEMDRTHTEHINLATAPVMVEMQRIQTALLMNKTPDPADQAKYDAAVAPYRDETNALNKLRADTIGAIRQELNREQLDAVRVDLGIPVARAGRRGGGGAGGGFGAAGGPGGAGGGFGAAGGPGGAGGGFGAAGGVGGNAGGANAGGGNGGGNFTPQNFMGRMMDRFRQMPQDQYDQMKDRMAGRMAQRQGLDPNSPEYAAAKTQIITQMDQFRQMPDQQYQQNRDQIANTLIQQFAPPGGAQAGAGGAPGGAGGGFGGGFGGFGPGGANTSVAELDNEAVRRFFLQGDALVYLNRHTAR